MQRLVNQCMTNVDWVLMFYLTTDAAPQFQYWFDRYCKHAFIKCMNGYNDYSQPLPVQENLTSLMVVLCCQLLFLSCRSQCKVQFVCVPQLDLSSWGYGRVEPIGFISRTFPNIHSVICSYDKLRHKECMWQKDLHTTCRSIWFPAIVNHCAPESTAGGLAASQNAFEGKLMPCRFSCLPHLLLATLWNQAH